MDASHLVDTPLLRIACHVAGPEDGAPVFLMHGFPYDIHAYEAVAPRLAANGCRVIVPYLRGFGATRFRDAVTPRSGEQAALGADLRALMDALGIARATLAGYDWGGRAACVVAALWPERCAGLVSFNSYNLQNIAAAMVPEAPESERRLWYQYYLHSARGRNALLKDRRAFIRLLWHEWSPSWNFDEACFARSAPAWDNPDFVEVVVQSYRHRFGLVAGDPALAGIEARLATQPTISVPTITFDGADDGVRAPAPPAQHAARFTGPRDHRVVPGVGHNMPQEAPAVFADAVMELIEAARRPRGNVQPASHEGFSVRYLNGYVEVRAEPGFELNLDSSFKSWQAGVELCRVHKVNRVLVTGPMRRNMTSIDALTSGGQALAEGLYGARLALCWDGFEPDELSTLFVAAIAARGVIARHFRDVDEAVRWLKSPQPRA